MAFCSLKHTPAFSDSTINNKTEKSSLVQSLVSKICPEWTIVPRESIEDLWQCHHCSSVQFSSTGETSSKRSSPTPSSVTQVCLQVQQQANAKLAFVFRWFLFVDDLEVTTLWWHTLSTKRSGGVFNLHWAVWIWIEAKICSCSVSSSLSAVLSITALVFIDLWHSLSLGIDEPSIRYWLCVERVPEEKLKKQMKRRLSQDVVCFNQAELHNLFGLLLRASSALLNLNFVHYVNHICTSFIMNRHFEENCS